MKSPMKKILAVAMTAVGCATIASAAGVANSISGIHSVKTHYPWDGKVDISYTSTASDGKGYILLDIGPTKRCITLTGADITVAPHKKTFDLHEIFGEFKAEVLASVDWVSSQRPDDAKGDATGILGDLMTIEIGILQQGVPMTSYQVNTYTNVDLGWFNCDTYKTTKLALLRIPAGRIWPARPGSSKTDTIVTTIAPAKDYWISIFPVTMSQYSGIVDALTVAGAVPKTASYCEVRGGKSCEEIIKPTDEVKATSIMNLLTARTLVYHGNKGKFDLPTEMQWEIAARAGSTSPFGHYVKAGKPEEPEMGTSDNLGDFACYGKLDVFGTKCPNMWGLYDMMGDVREWCLDQYEERVEWKDVETPHYNGPSDKRVLRGGWYNGNKDDCRPSYREGKAADLAGLSSDESSSVGFRLCFSFTE